MEEKEEIVTPIAVITWPKRIWIGDAYHTQADLVDLGV